MSLDARTPPIRQLENWGSAMLTDGPRLPEQAEQISAVAQAALSGSAPAWILSSHLTPNSHPIRKCVDKTTYTARTLRLWSQLYSLAVAFAALSSAVFCHSLFRWLLQPPLVAVGGLMLLHVFKRRPQVLLGKTVAFSSAERHCPAVVPPASSKSASHTVQQQPLAAPLLGAPVCYKVSCTQPVAAIKAGSWSCRRRCK